MASRLNPYLNFAGQAREAMEFYQGVLGGELSINRYADFDPSAADPDRVMHASLETPLGFLLMAADAPPGKDVDHRGVVVSISGDDAEELRGYWDKLSADAQKVTMPMASTPWAADFGMCTDRFGVPWMINIVAAGTAS